MHISISKVNFKSIGINIAKVDFGRYEKHVEIPLAITGTLSQSFNSIYFDRNITQPGHSTFTGGYEVPVIVNGNDWFVYTNDSPHTLVGCFANNNNITSVNICNLDCSNVNSIENMFEYCTYMTTCDVSRLNTSNVTLMGNVFKNCKRLTSLDLSSWDVSKVTRIWGMFREMNAIESIDLSSWNTSSLTLIPHLFYNVQSIKSIDMSGWNTRLIQNMEYAFYNCNNLKTLNLSGWDLTSLTSHTATFYNCSSLTDVYITVESTLMKLTNNLKSESFNNIPSTATIHYNDVDYKWNGSAWTVVDYTDYMTLSALGDGEITITIPAAINSSYATSLSYSKDKSTWNETLIDDTAQTISIPVTNGENVYLKGIAKQLGNSSTGVNINSTTNINASGNTMSLLYGDDYKDKVAFPSGSTYTFAYLFNGNTHLISAENLILPATTLAEGCYRYMFDGCTSLTAAPVLPATTLATNCYFSMFSGCTSLTTAPTLPATTLAEGCYFSMFLGCTSLTAAPVLPATTLATNCYTSMFYGCKSLTAAPELPATTLADSCYYNMFRDCISLTTAPELPATTLANDCYYGMLAGCNSLTTAPVLPATTLTRYCYTSMFQDCKSLTTAPELHATTLADSCYGDMFLRCRKLNNITMLATDISAPDCLKGWVSGVASTGTFTKAASMTTLPTGSSGIPEGWTVVDYTEYMTLSALGDGEITIKIPAEINSTYVTSISYSKDKSTWNETLIDDTEQTISIPVTSGENVYLKGIAKQLGKYNSFININASAGINASGNIMSLLYGDDYKDKVAFQAGSEYTFNNLFSGNTHLINAKDLVLPATTAASTCYYYMFNGCTSLTTAPALPATTLTYSCYSDMFYGCSSLNNITMLATDISASGCLLTWVYGVAPTGTFTKAAEMTTLPAGQSGIPEGWTVVDYGSQPTFYGIRGTANVTSTTLSNAISFNDTMHDVYVDENGKWEIEYNDQIYTSSNVQSLCQSNNITSIDFRNTIWATRSHTNKDTFNNLFFSGSVSNLKDVYFDFTGQDTNNMCLESGIFSALNNCRIHGFGTLNWSGEIDVSNTTSKHTFSLREFNRNGIIGTLDLRGIDTTSITDQDVSSINRTALSFDWTYGYWYLFPNGVHCDTIIIGSLEIQTNYFTAWNGPSSYCKTLYCTSPTPPSLSRTGANGLTCYNWLKNLSNLQNIYVPVGCLDAYKNDPDWSVKSSIMSEKEAPDPLSI